MRIITLSQLSLAGSSGIAEAKIPLWWADGTAQSTGTATTGTTFANDGTGLTTKTSASSLFTLSTQWLASQKVALEVTLYSASASYYANAQLYDITNSAVVGTSITTNSTTASVLRSNQFTLTPGHTYGVTVWISSTPSTAYLVDASLIIFP